MKICPKCKNSNNTEANKFCYQDGERLIERSNCRGCGAELASFFTFCPNCGQVIEAENSSVETDERVALEQRIIQKRRQMADFAAHSGHENDHFLEGEQGTDIEDSVERNSRG